MPIKIPDTLPATQTLIEENIFVMTDARATSQDIRPLEILLLNLMPTKIATETQFARLLGNTPLQVNLEFLQMSTHKSTHTSSDHLMSFYKVFDEIRNRKFDGMIITGAPVEQMPFEQVDYWNELCEIMEWSKSNVTSTFHICWGAQAGLYYHFGIDKKPLPEKLFGVFQHTVERKNSILFRGFDDVFYVPHSRHTTVDIEEVRAEKRLKILAVSPIAGLYCASTDGGRQVFVTGHSEYDARTLESEYLRDKKAGLPIKVPENYYPNDDDTKAPLVSWRGSANLLFSNWLNYFVYQNTPYDITKI